MHVMVLGAGVTGVTTAWYLVNAGFDVSVVERRPAAGLETTFANGGQISISHPEPWSSPSAPLEALRALGRADAPLRWRLSRDPAQWRWLLAFLRECLPQRHRRNAHAIASLAAYSGQCLHALRDETGIAYEQQLRGILHLFRTGREQARAHGKAEFLAAHGIRGRLCSADECLAIEPALARHRLQLAGGFYAPDDESGNALLFTQALAERCRAAGVRFYHDTTIRRLIADGGLIEGIEVADGTGRAGRLAAGAYVVCLGSHGAPLLAPLGLRLPVYPLKGYSVTAPLIDAEAAPVVSLTDESRRIVCSRLGSALRVAGTAELNGFDTSVAPERCAPLSRWLADMFPGVADTTHAQLWAGLRPATPGNVPLIGKGRGVNLWLNTGHGSLGWTLACGSASSLAALMSGRAPPVSGFPFLRPPR